MISKILNLTAYMRIQMYIFKYFSYPGCTCNSFIDREGYGKCEKRMFESFGCYVDFGSTCSDTKTFHGRLYSTSEACSKGIILHF